MGVIRRVKGAGKQLFGSDEEKAKIRRQLPGAGKTYREDPLIPVRNWLEDIKVKSSQDFAPRDYSLKNWWVFGFDDRNKRCVHGPYSTPGQANDILSTLLLDPGDIFDLPVEIETKAQANRVIARGLTQIAERDER